MNLLLGKDTMIIRAKIVRKIKYCDLGLKPNHKHCKVIGKISNTAEVIILLFYNSNKKYFIKHLRSIY